MLKVEDYIVFIKSQDGLTEGVGVLVGKHLITAGHVIEKAGAASFCFKRQTIYLKKEDALLYCYMDKDDYSFNGYDIAIFRFEQIDSPLILSMEKPDKSKEYLNISYHYVRITKSEVNYPAIFKTSYHLEQQKSIVEISEMNTDNFMTCHTSILLHEGSSGSPLLNSSNEVAGILCAGYPGTNKCVFQSATSILKLMKKDNIQ